MDFSSRAARYGGALEERRYISYSFMTSALAGGEWSASRNEWNIQQYIQRIVGSFLFYDAFSVTRLYRVDDKVISK
jgi:hypothetical protein